jgi:hypothetical protein
MMLSRETILGMGRPREVVDVPELGGRVTIAAMNLADRLDYERLVATYADDSMDHIPALLAFTLISENGERLFTNEDVKGLAELSAGVLFRLNRVAQRLNRIGDDEVTAAKGES